jgi:group I intron endonuclease
MFEDIEEFLASLPNEDHLLEFTNIGFVAYGERNGMFGKKRTDEEKLAVSRANIENTYALGRIRSRECREKISNFAKTRTGSLNSFYGRSHSEITKRNLSNSMKGKKPSNMINVSIDGIIYPSCNDAAKALGIFHGTIRHRANSKNEKYSLYFFIDQG